MKKRPYCHVQGKSSSRWFWLKTSVLLNLCNSGPVESLICFVDNAVKTPRGRKTIESKRGAALTLRDCESRKVKLFQMSCFVENCVDGRAVL